MISPDEERELTESKFWRPEVGKQYQVIMQGWRFERRAFKGDRQRQDPQEERPTLVMDVMVIDTIPCRPSKEFSSSNKALNRLLMAAVRYAESKGRSFIKVAMTRSTDRDYTVVDLGMVNDASDPRPAPARGQQPTQGTTTWHHGGVNSPDY